MDIVLMIVYATLILGFLVFIHEGGHYLAARATRSLVFPPAPSRAFVVVRPPAKSLCIWPETG